jgi:monofunctional biosynthetic peptidoglycan transglycosylase
MKWLRRIIICALLLSILPVLALRWIDPPTSAFMLQRQYEAWRKDQKRFNLKFEWVPWQAMSGDAALAVMAAEDQKFPQHWGFDAEQISKALEERQQGERFRGASTITQQVAKNLFLWPGKSFIRKGIEAYFTVLIELLWSKKRIMEIYLNLAQFGDDTFGIGAASRRNYGISPSRLQRWECAMLAVVLPDPKRMRLDRPSLYMWKRMNQILEEMDRLDRINGKPYVRQLATVRGQRHPE